MQNETDAPWSDSLLGNRALCCLIMEVEFDGTIIVNGKTSWRIQMPRNGSVIVESEQAHQDSGTGTDGDSY